VDVKKIGKIPAGGGWKAHGRQMGSTSAKRKSRIGYDYVHSMVDDHSRLAYSEVPPAASIMSTRLRSIEIRRRPSRRARSTAGSGRRRGSGRDHGPDAVEVDQP
jgi:hypothetical protein